MPAGIDQLRRAVADLNQTPDRTREFTGITVANGGRCGQGAAEGGTRVDRALDERHVRMDAGERALEHLAAVAAGAAGLRAAAFTERRRRHFPRARARRVSVAGDYIRMHHLFHIDSVYHTHF